MSRVIESVRGIVENQGLVIACSGGPDSIALAFACHEAGVGPLRIVHVNHQLRGDESNEDERFVVEFAHRLMIPIEVVHRPIIGHAHMEERAREARYDVLTSIAAGRPIATAHTADDRAETVLHRIIRGTGLTGLVGIEARPGIVRPFLSLRKQELIAYLESRGQTWQTDSSNASRRFTRNRIRHDLLPMLAELNPRVTDALVELAEQAGEWRVFVERQVDALLSDVERPRAGAMVILQAERLAAGDPLLIRELMRRIWTREGWTQRDMTAEHWRRLGRSEPGDYPGLIRVSLAGKVLRLGPITPPSSASA